MKKVWSILTLGLVLLLGNQSFAQDAKAKGVLDKFSAKIKSAKTVKADISFSIPGQQAMKGTFFLKGNKYRVNMGNQEIISDAKSVWTYLKNNKEVHWATYNPAEQAISPAKLFSSSFEKDYTFKYVSEKTVNGKKVDVIELSPKSKSAGFSKLELQVDKSNMITGGKIIDGGGNSYTYSISNVQLNTSLSDNQFTFTPSAHPGVEVIDLR